MGRLAGFKDREIVKQLKEVGLTFHRQAAGSHEIGSTNHFARRRAGSCRWRSSLLLEPIVHGRPTGEIDACRKSFGNGHPADGNGLRPARGNGRSAKLTPEPALDECPQGLSQFSRQLLGSNNQIVGEVDRGLHLRRRIPEFTDRQSSDGKGAKKVDLPSFSGWRLVGVLRHRRATTAGAT